MKNIKNFEELNEEANNEETFPLSPNRIYNILSGAKFEKWYDKDFIDHIEGTANFKSKEQILEEIKNMFK